MTNVADLTSVEKIIVLDFGSQFNQLITRRIREFGVFSELLSHRTTAEEIRKIAPKGIISQVDQTACMTKMLLALIQKFMS